MLFRSRRLRQATPPDASTSSGPQPPSAPYRFTRASFNTDSDGEGNTQEYLDLDPESETEVFSPSQPLQLPPNPTMAAQIDWTAFQNAMAIKDEAMNAQLESSEHNTSSSCDILLSRNLSLRLIPI